MRQLRIRAAHADEKSLLEAIQWRASLANAGDRAALLTHPDAVEVPHDQIAAGWVFVAQIDERPLGFAAILWREDGDAELDGLFVEPDAWRQGIGRGLVDYCATQARAGGAAAIHVVGNPHARDFYLSCGFRLNGTQETRFGIGLLMRKAVQNATESETTPPGRL